MVNLSLSMENQKHVVRGTNVHQHIFATLEEKTIQNIAAPNLSFLMFLSIKLLSDLWHQRSDLCSLIFEIPGHCSDENIFWSSKGSYFKLGKYVYKHVLKFNISKKFFFIRFISTFRYISLNLDGNPCEMSLAQGVGNLTLTRYYFDRVTHLCQTFIYRGAKGNANNFLTVDDCESICPGNIFS